MTTTRFLPAALAALALLTAAPAYAAPNLDDLDYEPYDTVTLWSGESYDGDGEDICAGDRHVSEIHAYTDTGKALKERKTKTGLRWAGKGGDVIWNRKATKVSNKTKRTVKVAYYCD